MIPNEQGARIRAVYDALDDDLVLEVGDFGWFEWFDLSDSTHVVAELVAACASVRDADVWAWRAAHTRGCDLRLRDGTIRSATDAAHDSGV